MAVTDTAPPAKKERWTYQWKELHDEVITSGLCTGCAGCVISCPHDVIGYEHEPGAYKPFHLEEELGTSDCVHGQLCSHILEHVWDGDFAGAQVLTGQPLEGQPEEGEVEEDGFR